MQANRLAQFLDFARRAAPLAIIATTLGLAYGIWYCYSVILVALLAEFGWSRSLLAGAFSVFAIVHGTTNPLVGFLCDRVRPSLLVGAGGLGLGASLWANSYMSEPWHLYTAFGLTTAMSVAMCGWLPALVMVQRRYQHRIGLAMGIVGSGIGVGMLTVVPLCQVLIDAHGWRTAFRVLGCICTFWIVPAAVYLWITNPKSSPATVTAPADEEFVHDLGESVATNNSPSTVTSSITLAMALRSAPFWLMVAAFFFGSICSQTLHVHQVAFLVDHGVSALVAASVVGVVGLASVFGKTGGGWLSDRVERELVFVCGISILVASVGALAWVGSAPSSLATYAYAIMLGVGYSATASLVPAMMSDRFSGVHFGSIIGIGLFGSAVGSAIGPWMAGYLFDHFGNYRIAFVIAAISGTISGLAGWVARSLRLRGQVVAH
ncbi:MAG: MFS family permease [Gammaproteobacteria bacterium]|jgi:MFS family permease